MAQLGFKRAQSDAGVFIHTASNGDKVCHSPYFRSDLLRRVSNISDVSVNLRPFTIHLLVLAPTLALYSALYSITPPLL